MAEYATVKPEGLNLHQRADLESNLVDQLAKGDRVEIINRRRVRNIELAEVIVRRTKTGIGEGESGWVRASFLELEHFPDPPDVPYCDPIPETDPFPLGTYIVYGLIAVGIMAAIAWVFNNI